MNIISIYASMDKNLRTQRNDNSNKVTPKIQTDAFISSKKISNEEQKEINKKRTKLRETLWKTIYHNDVEGLKSIIYGKDVYPALLHTASRYYDSMLRSENSSFGYRKKVNHEMGDIIYKAILDEKLKTQNGIHIQSNPYLSIIHDVRYGLTNQFTMSVLKKAFETKDPTLLRLTIETLKNENRPYEKMLLDVVDEIKKENA